MLNAIAVLILYDAFDDFSRVSDQRISGDDVLRRSEHHTVTTLLDDVIDNMSNDISSRLTGNDQADVI